MTDNEPFALQNQGDSQETVYASSLGIVDDEGREFEPITNMSVDMLVGGNNCSSQELPAGVPKLCRLIYEVPAYAKGFKFKAHNLALIFREEKLIDLGF